MFKINDSKKLNYYINKYKINEIFSNNMIPYMEMHHFKKNEHICLSGEELKYLYFFVEKRVRSKDRTLMEGQKYISQHLIGNQL